MSKTSLYITFMAFFVAYLMIANDLFLKWIPIDGEDKPFDIEMTSDSEEVFFHIDRVDFKNIKWRKYINIRGWSYKDRGVHPKKRLVISLSNKKESSTFLVSNNELKRKNLARKFNLDQSRPLYGFNAMIPTHYFKDSIYRIGVVIEDENGLGNTSAGGSSKNYLFEVHFKDGNVDLVKNKRTNRSAKNRDIRSSTNIKYAIDEYEYINAKITIRGWAIMKNTDQILGTMSKLLLRSSNNTFAYNLDPVVREDVGIHFNNRKLDNSGFNQTILISDLPKDSYEILISLFIQNDSLEQILPYTIDLN